MVISKRNNIRFEDSPIRRTRLRHIILVQCEPCLVCVYVCELVCTRYMYVYVDAARLKDRSIAQKSLSWILIQIESLVFLFINATDKSVWQHTHQSTSCSFRTIHRERVCPDTARSRSMQAATRSGPMQTSWPVISILTDFNTCTC